MHILWASSFAGIHVGLRGFGATEFALLRFIIASVSLLGYELLPGVRDVPGLFLVGFLGFTVFHVSLSAGRASATAQTANSIVASMAVFSTLLAVMFLKKEHTALGGARVFS